MRCVRCGGNLTEDAERCPRCGALAAAVAAAPPMQPGVGGIPVIPFSPTLSGPPVAPEPYLMAMGMPELVAPRRSAGVRMVLPQPALRRRAFWLWSSAILALFVLAGLGAGLLALTGTLPVLPFTQSNSGQTAMRPTVTAPPICTVAPADPAAAQALAHAQLTTGVRNEQAQDFRPVDDVSSFHVGTRAFITYAIATQDAGTAGVLFCTPVGTFPGTLAIPAGSRSRYAQFSLVLPEASLGDGVATLTWNGAVAASLPFTITA